MSLEPNSTTVGTLNRATLGVTIAIHAGAIAAPYFFTWLGLVLCVLLGVLTGHIGISLGFHRLLTHQSFKATTICRRILATLGTLALQAGPLKWIAIHRLHHRYTDTENDPHTPRFSFFWAHLCWTFFPDPQLDEKRIRALSRDVAVDPFMGFLDRHNFLIAAVFVVVLFTVCSLAGGLEFGVSCFLWGGCVRIVYIWHTTFLVNSLAHSWGYRNYAVANDSRNSIIVSIFAPGDGWHNNHHAFPRSAAHGHRLLEFDPIYWFIMFLKSIGFVSRVVVISPSSGMKAIKKVSRYRFRP
jgi:fatty-acid desaturase